jgi:hypothetical protein
LDRLVYLGKIIIFYKEISHPLILLFLSGFL